MEIWWFPVQIFPTKPIHWVVEMGVSMAMGVPLVLHFILGCSPINQSIDYEVEPIADSLTTCHVNCQAPPQAPLARAPGKIRSHNFHHCCWLFWTGQALEKNGKTTKISEGVFHGIPAHFKNWNIHCKYFCKFGKTNGKTHYKWRFYWFSREKSKERNCGCHSLSCFGARPNGSDGTVTQRVPIKHGGNFSVMRCLDPSSTHGDLWNAENHGYVLKWKPFSISTWRV